MGAELCFPWPLGEGTVICSCRGFNVETSHVNSDNILSQKPWSPSPPPYSSSTSMASRQITPVFSGVRRHIDASLCQKIGIWVFTSELAQLRK